MKRISFILIVLFLASTKINYGQTNSVTNDNSTIISNNKAKVVLITTSQACKCIKKRCNLIDKQITQIMTNQNYSNIEVLKIDYAKEKDKANTILNKYSLGGIPIIIIINRKQEILYNQSYGINKDKIIQILDKVAIDEK